MAADLHRHTLDARGKACPQPIIELAQAIRALGPGEHIQLIADDPAAAADVQAWCEATGHELVGLERSGRQVHAQIAKRARVD